MRDIAPAKAVASWEDMVRLGRADLTAFSRWPLPMRGHYELWDCQKRMQKILQDAYLAHLRDPEGTPGGACILAPAEHGKTSSLAVPFILWVLARNRNLRVIVAGSKDDLAANVGGGIDRVFANKSEDLRRFGLEVGYPWNANEKFVKRDNDALIHPSILCVGPESEFQGKRADVIVCTDVFTFKNQRSVEARQKISDWLHQTLLPRLEPWGFILFEGHHVHSEDGYTEIEESGDYPVHKFRAILEEPCEANGGKGKILAPEQWTYRQLAAKRARKPHLFQLMYQNVPVAEKGMISRDILDQSRDHSRALVYSMNPDTRAAYAKIVMSVDPAFTTRRWSSRSACWVRGQTESGRKDYLAGWAAKMLPHQLEAKIVTTILAMKPHVCYIEANAAQVFLVENVRRKLLSLSQDPSIVKPVITLGHDDNSVEQAVSNAVIGIETGLTTFPYQGHEAQDLTEMFFTELLNFPTGKHSDVLMAAVIADQGEAKHSEDGRRTVKVDLIGRQARRSPWRR